MNDCDFPVWKSHVVTHRGRNLRDDKLWRCDERAWSPAQCATPAAPQTPALLSAPRRSSSASSSHCICAEPSGAREELPSHGAHRDPTTEKTKKKLVTKSSVVPWTRQYMMTKMFTCIYVRRVNWKRIFMLLLKKTSLVRHLTHPWGVDAFKREMFGAWSTYRIQPSGIQTCSPLITSLIPLPLGHRLKTWL